MPTNDPRSIKLPDHTTSTFATRTRRATRRPTLMPVVWLSSWLACLALS
jgi:hypothetical protein